MKNSNINYYKVFLVLSLILAFSGNADAFIPTYTYSAEVQATLSTASTGKGLVYVDDEASGYITVPDASWRPNSEEAGSVGGNSTNTYGGDVPVYLYAKPNTGYQFDGWSDDDNGTPGDKGTLYNGVYRSVQDFRAGTNPRKRVYNIFAFFSPIHYTITYDADGGTLSSAFNTQDYTIESTSSVYSATKANNTFSGWKVTSTDGIWPAVNGIVEAGTLLTGKYGSISVKAVWIPVLSDIIISVSGLQPGESALFTVSKNNVDIFTVPLTGNLTGTPVSVTIKDQEAGANYVVKPASWAWTYDSPSPASHTFVLASSAYTAEFTVTKKTDVKKHDEQSKVNWR